MISYSTGESGKRSDVDNLYAKLPGWRAKGARPADDGPLQLYDARRHCKRGLSKATQ